MSEDGERQGGGFSSMDSGAGFGSWGASHGAETLKGVGLGIGWIVNG